MKSKIGVKKKKKKKPWECLHPRERLFTAGLGVSFTAQRSPQGKPTRNACPALPTANICVAVLKSRDSTKFSCLDKGDSILTWVGAAGYSPSSGRACNPWPETARLDQPVLSKPEREENLMEREGPSNYSLFSLITLAASPSPYLHPWHQSSN